MQLNSSKYHNLNDPVKLLPWLKQLSVLHKLERLLLKQLLASGFHCLIARQALCGGTVLCHVWEEGGGNKE